LLHMSEGNICLRIEALDVPLAVAVGLALAYRPR